MIDRIQLLRNVGQFDSVSVPANLVLSKVSVIYAENGRGKTTLAAILRSLGTGDGALITARRRLGSPNAPHVVINAGNPCLFQDGQWSQLYTNIAVFDDTFVAENVCSGVEIGAEHRQALHELILGAQGVSLNAALQLQVTAIEEHNKALKSKGDAIPAMERGSLTVDVFCALKARPNVDKLIEESERDLSAAQSSEAVAQRRDFVPLSLPRFEVGAIQALLSQNLASLDTAAATRVRLHLASLGRPGESWVAQGMTLIPRASEGKEEEVCPFCAQGLGASEVIGAYRAYFSETYASLKTSVATELSELHRNHGNEAPAAFERSIRLAVELREFWKAFVEVPEFQIDTAAIARKWNRARNIVADALEAKKSSPLETVMLSPQDLQVLDEYERAVVDLDAVSSQLTSANRSIAFAKEKAKTANALTLVADLAKLRASKARHGIATNVSCQSYLAEIAAKSHTESLRDAARGLLDAYRTSVFPAYESAINAYLARFNAGFRLNKVESVNTRGGSSCSYNVLINNIAVSVSGPSSEPCFRNTLSAGDRNTLALAFFFTSLDQDLQQADKIVVIDDPMTSLDEHRALTTVQETGRLSNRVEQVIVMSHSKGFLCDIWQSAERNTRTALRIARLGTGSAIAAWDVNSDLVTEHDRRHATVSAYIHGPITIQGTQGPGERVVATYLRHILEAFVRVAYPAQFPPGALLGAFHMVCSQRVGTTSQILDESNTTELRDLLDYANKFHHETNAAYETEFINDQELLSFCERTLKFTSRQ